MNNKGTDIKEVNVSEKGKVLNRVSDVLIYVYIFVLALITSLQCSITPIKFSIPAIDSGVFRYGGMVICNGLMPYRDSFDHKGPLTYLINALGYSISPLVGIWFVELVFIFVTFIFMYKISRLVTGKIVSVIVLTMTSFYMFHYFCGGNVTEEYAVAFICIGLYVFAKYFIRGEINRIGLMVCGFCLGGAFLLKPNFVTMWIVMCMGVLVSLIAKKEIKKLGSFIGWFLLGVVILVLPIVVWLAINGALKDFWFQTMTFNFEYVDYVSVHGIKERYSVINYYVLTPVVLGAVISSGVVCVVKRKLFDFCHFAVLVLTLLISVFVGLMLPPYGVLTIPFLVYPYASFAEIFENKTIKLCISGLCFGLLLVLCAIPNWAFMLENISQDLKTPTSLETCKDINDVVISSYIREHTSEEDKITVYGNYDIYYVLSGRLSVSRYSYQTPIFAVDSSLSEEYKRNLKEDSPAVILVLGNEEHETGRILKELAESMDYNMVEMDALTEEGYMMFLHPDNE